MEADALITGFLSAALLGMAIGLQRQLSKADFTAGARTYALYAVWGAGAAWLGGELGGTAFGAALLAFVALVLASFVLGVREGAGRGTTGEAAALVTFLVGVLAFRDQIVAAAAVAVGTAVLLEAKRPLHGLERRISQEDARAVLQFGMVTVVLLPLAPDRQLGPLQALNPREIWLMVVLVSAIGLAGYVALRLTGSRGLALTGLLGGLVSSTAVTLGFSRMSRTLSGALPVLLAGLLGASALMYVRVWFEARIIAPALASRLLAPLLVLLLIVGGVAVRWFMARDGKTPEGRGRELDLKNPLSLGTALQFGLLYAGVVLLATWLLDEATGGSLLVVGAASGVADVDAITLSMANLVRDGLDPSTAARAVMAAVTVNTFVKLGTVVALGSALMRRSAVRALLPAGVVAGVWTALL